MAVINNKQEKKITTIKEEERHIFKEAIFSAQYERKLSMKYFLLTKKSVFIISTMFILNYYDLLHLYVGMALTMYLMFSFLKNDINMYEREKDDEKGEANAVWLLKLKRKISNALEDEFNNEVENRSKGLFLKDFFDNYNKG